MSPVRVPQQSRSRALVARILDAAGELFAGQGFERTTTKHIAEKAGVSVGSLYQFFVDKHAILSALQADWTVRLGDALDESLDVGDDRAITQIVDSVLDVHARLDREQPGLLGVLLTTHSAAKPLLSVRDTVQVRLEEMIEVRTPSIDPATRRIAAAMLIHLSLGLYSLPRSLGRDGIRAEVRRSLVAYLDSLEA